MPCKCDYPDPGPEQIDALTQDLCYLCGTLLDKALFNECASGRIKAWWSEHLAADTERVREQMVEKFNSHPDPSPDGVTSGMIASAQNVHPVSKWHMRWFAELATQTHAAVKAARQQRHDAFAKLTPEERELLGLNREY